MRLSKKDFTREEWEYLVDIAETDGAEVHKDDWPLAEALAKKGAVTLGHARGPRSEFRRVELIMEPVVEGL